MRTAIGSKRASVVFRAAHTVLESLESRRLLSTGSLDSSFGNNGIAITDFPGPNADLTSAAAKDGDGYVVVGSTIGEQARPFVARYEASGARDTAFGVGGVALINSLYDVEAVASDSNGIVVAGSLFDGEAAVARFTASGAVDTSFGTNGVVTIDPSITQATGIAFDNANHIVISAQSISPQSGGDFAVIRLMSNGTVDTSFDGDGIATADFGANDVANAVATSADEIVVVGSAVNDSGDRDVAVAVFTADGALSANFFNSDHSSERGLYTRDIQSVSATTDDDVAQAVAVRNNQITIGGTTGGAFFAMRLLADGTEDLSFGGSTAPFIVVPIATTDLVADDHVSSMALDASDNIVLAGSSDVDSAAQCALAQITSTGALTRTIVRSFPAGPSSLSAVLFTGDGSIRAFGASQTARGDSDLTFLGLTSSGEADNFGTAGTVIDGFTGPQTNGGAGVAQQTDGKLIVVGNTNYGNRVVASVTRYNTDGSLDTSFGLGGRATLSIDVDDEAKAVAIDSNGKIYVGITVSHTDGSDSDFALARFNSNGTLDTGFNSTGYVIVSDPGNNDDVNAIAINGGNIYLAGTQGAPGGDDNFTLAKISSSGNVIFGDSSNPVAVEFNNDPNSPFRQDDLAGMAIDGNGNIVLSGTATNGTSVDFALARLTSNGALDGSFGNGGRVITNLGFVENGSVMIDGSGSIFVAGFAVDSNTSVAGTVVLKYDSTGTLDNSFGTNGVSQFTIGEGAIPVAVASTANGTITIGASEFDQDGFQHFSIAQIDSSGALVSDFGSGGTNVFTIGGNDVVSGMAVQSDGDIVLAGTTDAADQAVLRIDGGQVAVTPSPVANAGADQTVNEGDLVQFDGTASTGTGLTFAWDLDGDGQFDDAVGPTASLTYPDNANVVVSLQVTDSQNRTSIDSLNLTIQNVAPTIIVTGANTSDEGSSYSLGFSATDPGDDTISTWSIDWGDGNSESFAGTSNGANHTYADNGNYSIVVSATDEDGSYSAAPKSVAVATVAPTITVTGASSTGEGTPYSIDFSATDPGDDTISAWSVDWGDGHSVSLAGNATGATHTFTHQGNFNVVVSATDEDGTYNADPNPVAVSAVAPAIVVTGDNSVDEGSPYSLSFSANESGDETVSAWSIDWGDGNTDSLAGNSSSALHTYADGDANYSIVVSATDDNGTHSAAPKAVAVNNVAPTLTVTGAATANEGSTYVLSLGATDPGADTISSWSIDWGDGNTSAISGNPSSANHTFADNGNYGIIAKATDEDGQYTAQTVQVSVANLPPTASISGPSTIQQGTSANFTLGATDPSPIDAAANFAFNIDWDGNGSIDQTVTGPTGSIVAHTFGTTGNFTIKVTAVDKDGAASVSPGTLAINVTPPSPPDHVTAQVLADPLNPNETMLLITGTNGNDDIKLKSLKGANSDGVEVRVSGILIGTYFPTARVVIYGNDGADTVVSAGKFKRPVEIYGGAGDDKLTAGDSGDIVVGGPGADTLKGGPGMDLLIGSAGADKIDGQAGDDILIAGTTSYDNDPVALNAISAEWNSTRSYSSRIANIMGSNPITADFNARLNGNYFFRADGPNVTVFDDGAKDTLNGGDGAGDWFLFNNDGPVNDKANNKPGEVVTDID